MSRTLLSEMGNFTPLLDGLARQHGIITAAVFGRIWRYCGGERQACYATLETIGRELGLDASTVQRHAKRLCQLGYLEDTTPDLHNKPHCYRDTGKVRMVVSFDITGDEPDQQPSTVGGREEHEHNTRSVQAHVAHSNVALHTATSRCTQQRHVAQSRLKKEVGEKEEIKIGEVAGATSLSAPKLYENPTPEAPIPPQVVELESRKQTHYRCPYCGELQKVNFRDAHTTCCGAEVSYRFPDGSTKNAPLIPRTPAASYLARATSAATDARRHWAAFHSEAERDQWEAAEAQFGSTALAEWVDWAVGKGIPKKTIVQATLSALTRNGVLNSGVAHPVPGLPQPVVVTSEMIGQWRWWWNWWTDNWEKRTPDDVALTFSNQDPWAMFRKVATDHPQAWRKMTSRMTPEEFLALTPRTDWVFDPEPAGWRDQHPNG